MPANREQRRSTAKKSVVAEADKVKTKLQADRIGRKGVTSASDWRKGRAPVFVELPSGHVCKAINKGMDAFLRAGKIPNSLMPIITSAINKAEGKPSASEIGAEVMQDPEQIAAALELCDVVVCECVREPRILPVPKMPVMHDPDKEHPGGWQELVEIPIESREDPGDALWVDETDLDDRWFIFNWVVGGTQDVEQFRSKLAGVVDDLSELDEAGAEA
jgi:hypothetical protein